MRFQCHAMVLACACLTGLAGLSCECNAADEAIGPNVVLVRGATNTVTISREGSKLAVYGVASDQSPEQLLITHHRRDALRGAMSPAAGSAAVVAPAAERNWISDPHAFWHGFAKARFHDYSCSTTKILTQPLKVDRWVSGGDEIIWRGIRFQVLDTPGYTPGAVSYYADIDGQKLVFVGDLIYGDGQLLDLYSLQDAIEPAAIRGYHGYAGRLAGLVSSLQRIRQLQPDRMIPARGPVIENPQAAIDKLIDRVQRLYKNYLSTGALHWYFKADRMRLCGERVLGVGADIELMPYAHHEKAPDWIFENATSRVLISDSGAGWLIDCGYDRVIEAVDKLIESGLIQRVEGIFVTHYHDDHTDRVQAAADKFGCPVYATEEYADILENPAAYRMPAMTDVPIKNIQRLKSGHGIKWHEFDFTFHFFPGQALYHGALLVRRGNERPVFFIGDSFAPSGIDDYCLQNRNLVGAGQGYNLCLEKLRSATEPVWLVNEHIPYVFRFSPAELDYLEQRYAQRTELLRSLFPWDSPNYGIDEQWATFFPYAAQASPGQPVDLSIRVTNHSPVARRFKMQVRTPAGLKLVQAPQALELDSGQTGWAKLRIEAGAAPGQHVITADISSGEFEFSDWVEALITVP